MRTLILISLWLLHIKAFTESSLNKDIKEFLESLKTFHISVLDQISEIQVEAKSEKRLKESFPQDSLYFKELQQLEKKSRQLEQSTNINYSILHFMFREEQTIKAFRQSYKERINKNPIGKVSFFQSEENRLINFGLQVDNWKTKGESLFINLSCFDNLEKNSLNSDSLNKFFLVSLKEPQQINMQKNILYIHLKNNKTKGSLCNDKQYAKVFLTFNETLYTKFINQYFSFPKFLEFPKIKFKSEIVSLLLAQFGHLLMQNYYNFNKKEIKEEDIARQEDDVIEDDNNDDSLDVRNLSPQKNSVQLITHEVKVSPIKIPPVYKEHNKQEESKKSANKTNIHCVSIIGNKAVSKKATLINNFKF